jgi:hypothetical protein
LSRVTGSLAVSISNRHQELASGTGIRNRHQEQASGTAVGFDTSHVAVEHASDLVRVAKERQHGLGFQPMKATKKLDLRCGLPKGTAGVAQKHELLRGWSVMPFCGTDTTARRSCDTIPAPALWEMESEASITRTARSIDRCHTIKERYPRRSKSPSLMGPGNCRTLPRPQSISLRP